MKYREAIDWLYGTQLFGIKLGLENVGRLFEELGLFDKLAGRRVIHVAGTNGKGSVCAMVDAILRAGGKRSGLYTSPHLVSFRERIRVNGEMMPDAAIAAGLSKIRQQGENWDSHPTFFEITTALAVAYFCERNCDVLVMETGMGGRLDATNIMPADVSVITPIGMDHTQWLGESLGEIAAEKAGIIKPGVPVVSAKQEPEAEAVISRAAESAQSPLTVISKPVPAEWSVGLLGTHQRENAALAAAAIDFLDWEFPENAVREGLAGVSWPGRFQRIGDRMVVDGTHNQSAVAALVETWKQSFGDEKATVVFGGVNSKNTPEILERLAVIANAFVFVPVRSQRGLSTEELGAAWAGLENSGIPVRSETSVSEALRKLKGRLLVTGSLFLAGEALSELESRGEFEVSEQ